MLRRGPHDQAAQEPKERLPTLSEGLARSVSASRRAGGSCRRHWGGCSRCSRAASRRACSWWWRRTQRFTGEHVALKRSPFVVCVRLLKSRFRT